MYVNDEDDETVNDIVTELAWTKLCATFLFSLV